MAYAPDYDSTGIEYYNIPSFTFTSGATLPIRLAYRTFNSPSSPKKALIPTCYGGIINSTLTFTSPTQPLHKHHVVVIAMLGNGESSSPSNTPSFPNFLDYRDCIRAQHALVTNHLGWTSLDTVLGFSMGGQQAYYWACMYPTFIKTAIVICSSARTSGHNHAFLEGPLAALQNSIDYADGAYKTHNTKPERGLRAFGRAYAAWLTSAAWYRAEMWKHIYNHSTIEEYLLAQAEPMVLHWDAEDVIILARMWQAGDVGVTHSSGEYGQALRGVEARVLVMPGRTDQYFSVEDSGVEMGFLRRAELAVVESVWGHAAGGGMCEEDVEWMGGRIGRFLREGKGVDG